MVLPANHPGSLPQHKTSGVSLFQTTQAGEPLVPTPDGLIATIPTGQWPGPLALDSGNGYLYVGNIGSDNVSVIDTGSDTVVTSIPLGDAPVSVGYDSHNGNVYVPVRNGSIGVIDGNTNTLFTWIPGSNLTDSYSSQPSGFLQFDPSKGVIYESSSDDFANFIVINDTTNRQNHSIIDYVNCLPCTSHSSSFAFDSSNGFLYQEINDDNQQQVFVFSSTSWGGSPTAIIPISQHYPTFQSADLVFDRVNGNVYCQPTDSSSAGATSNITVISGGTNQIVATITTGTTGGTWPDEFAVNSLGDVYELLYGSSNANVTLILGEANTASWSIPIAAPLGWPAGIVFDDSDKELYVTTNGTGLAVFGPPTLTASISTRYTSVDANQTIVFQSHVSGGLPPYTFSYSPSKSAAGCSVSTSPQLSCTPVVNGTTFNVTVTVTDAYGSMVHAVSPLIAVYSTLHATLVASNNTPLLGQTIALVANATGGTSPYAYNFTGLPPGCVSENKPALGCLPTQADYYNVTAQVTDSSGATVNAAVQLHVIFDFNVVVPTNTSAGSPFTISVNTNETFSSGTAVVPAGGIGTLTYNYTGLPPGCFSADASSITCTPTQVGTYHISVSVHDQAGDHQTHTVVVNVVPVKAAPGFLGLSGDIGYAVIGAVVAAAAALVALFALRRRSRSRTSGAPRNGGPQSQSSEKSVDHPVSSEEKPTTTSASTNEGTVTVSQSDWEDMRSRLDKLEKKGP